MSAEAVTVTAKLADLRAPFAENQVSKLPKNVAKDGPSQSCGVCHGYHRRAGLHLDYVGHAAVTDRLLDVDPLWTWEPAAIDDTGQPILARNGNGVPIGLWIKLTVCGVTRWGYGSVEAGKGEAVKELIGDAIRNAAMRFGVALYLWHKGDLHTDDTGDSSPEAEDVEPATAESIEAVETLVTRAKALKIEGDYDAARAFAVQSEPNVLAAIDRLEKQIAETDVPF